MTDIQAREMKMTADLVRARLLQFEDLGVLRAAGVPIEIEYHRGAVGLRVGKRVVSALERGRWWDARLGTRGGPRRVGRAPAPDELGGGGGLDAPAHADASAAVTRPPAAEKPLILDPPVGPHSDPREIHGWLDELEKLREENRRRPSAVARIDEEVARAVGWLEGKDALSGRGIR